MFKQKRIICTVINSVEYDQRMQRICTTLQENGYEVLLIGRNEKKGYNITPKVYKQLELTCFFNKKAVMYAEYNLRLLLYLLFNKCDIICGVDLDTIIPAILIAKLKRIPSVYDAHEYFPGVPEIQKRPSIKGTWERVERFAFRHATEVYTVSSSIAHLFERIYKRKVGLIRNMPIAQPLPEKMEKIPRSLFYQGALNAGRGLEYIIHAMRYINGTFYIAGEGDLSEPLRELANKAGLLNTKIKFLGKVKPEDLHQLTPTMFIGINLLESTSPSYFYSLSNKTFDYIQAGVPQICINFPEYRALNETYHVMHMVNDFKIETLTQSIGQLFDDTAYYNQLCINCAKASKELTWGNEAPHLLSIYNRL